MTRRHPTYRAGAAWRGLLAALALGVATRAGAQAPRIAIHEGGPPNEPPCPLLVVDGVAVVQEARGRSCAADAVPPLPPDDVVSLQRMPRSAVPPHYGPLGDHGVIVVETRRVTRDGVRMPPPPPGYAVRAAIALSPERDAMRGRLELLEDARIRPTMRDAAARGHDPCDEYVAAVLRPLCADTSRGERRVPLRPALLRLVDARGRVRARHALERPVAELVVARLRRGPRRTFLVGVDLSADMGADNGPNMRLFEPTRAGLGWLTATDARTGRRDTISLWRTLRADWRLVARADGTGRELLQVSCHPDYQRARTPADTSVRFVIDYMRWSHQGGRWVHRERTRPGFYETENGGFPPRADFP